jgi:hypothetical protein
MHTIIVVLSQINAATSMDHHHIMIVIVFLRAHNSILSASFTILMILSPTYQYSGTAVIII